MKKLFLFLSVFISAVIISCEKEKETNNDDPEEIVVNVSKDLFNWLYYSFSENKLVDVNDFTNDLNWDLGIRYENFRTNGGKSGKGQGGVYDLGAVNFDLVTISSINSATFIPDDSISVIVLMAMPPEYETVPGSVPLENMFQSPAGPGSRTYPPNNHVYVIKTAKGKHVKFIGTSFFNDRAEEGYLHFKFEFLD